MIVASHIVLFQLKKHYFVITSIFILHICFCSCNGPEDDIFKPCFQCEGFSARQVYGDEYSDAIEYDFFDRQSGERFQATRQSARVLCRRGANGQCISPRLRVNRGMQMRSRTYARALEFIHAEQYLSQEDVDLIFRFLFSV